MVGGSALGIGVTMFLRDQFSGPAARVRNAAQMTSREMMRMQEQQMRQQRNMYAGLAMAGGMAIRKMGKVIGSAAKFGYEMEFVKQISKSSDVEMGKMSRQAMELGQSTIFLSKDVAEGMRFMAMAGMDFNEVQGNIAAAVDLAAAANLSIAGRGGSADIMTNIMKAFQKDASESSYVADILAEAATSANTNVFELGEALKYAGSTAMDLNIPLESAAAMAMTLANAGMQGSMAGVAMENSMRYLARSISSFATGTQKKALAAAGVSSIDFQDANGNLLPMVQNIGKLKKALSGMGNVQKQAILQTLFGVRGKRAGSLLIRNFEEYQGHLQTFQGAQGRSAEISAGMMDTLEGDFLRIKASWQNMGLFFTQSLEPVLRPLLSILEKVITSMQKIFSTPILGSALATGIAAFLVIKTAAWAYKAVVLGIRLVTMQAGASTATMMANGIAGWNSMTVAAKRYSTAAMVAGMSGRTAGYGGMAQMAGRGKLRGVTTNIHGRMIAKQGGKFVSGASAAGIAAGTMRMVGGNAVSDGATRMVLGKILGVLGGPIGLALSFVLPAAIGALVGALGRNKDSQDAGVEAMKEMNRAKMSENMQYTRMGHMIKFQDINEPAMKVIGTTGIGETSRQMDQAQLKRLADTLEQILATPSHTTVQLDLDGEVIDERIIKYQADGLQMFQ